MHPVEIREIPYPATYNLPLPTGQPLRVGSLSLKRLAAGESVVELIILPTIFARNDQISPEPGAPRGGSGANETAAEWFRRWSPQPAAATVQRSDK